MLRAVESHVLQEVGQTLLRVILLDGTHTLGDVEVGLLLRGVVVTQIVRQAIVEFADTHTVVDGNLRHLHLLLGRCQPCRNQGYCHKKSSKFHFYINLLIKPFRVQIYGLFF